MSTKPGFMSVLVLLTATAELYINKPGSLPYGREAVIFTAVEKLTRNYIAIRISGRTSSGVEEAMNQLEDLYGTNLFSMVFKTITADNGAEFSTFSNFEKLGTKVYFAHPYSFWERAQKERHNGIL